MVNQLFQRLNLRKSRRCKQQQNLDTDHSCHDAPKASLSPKHQRTRDPRSPPPLIKSLKTTTTATPATPPHLARTKPRFARTAESSTSRTSMTKSTSNANTNRSSTATAASVITPEHQRSPRRFSLGGRTMSSSSSRRKLALASPNTTMIEPDLGRRTTNRSSRSRGAFQSAPAVTPVKRCSSSGSTNGSVSAHPPPCSTTPDRTAEMGRQNDSMAQPPSSDPSPPPPKQYQSPPSLLIARVDSERDGDDNSDGYHRYDEPNDDGTHDFDIDYRGHYVPKDPTTQKNNETSDRRSDSIVQMALQASVSKRSTTSTECAPQTNSPVASTITPARRKKQPKNWSELLDKRGNDLYDQGKHDQAFANYEEALKIKRQALLGEYNALKLSDVSPDERASVLASMATSINNLTYLRQIKGQASTEETLASYETALQIKREILGDTHLSVGKTLNNIGSVQYLQRQYFPAAASYEQARDILQQNLGADHLDVCTVSSNLGDVHFCLGQWRRAVLEYRSALSVRWKLLGPTDKKVVRLMEQVAELEMKLMRKEGPDAEDEEPSVDYDSDNCSTNTREEKEDFKALHDELRKELDSFDTLLGSKATVARVKERTAIFRELRELNDNTTILKGCHHAVDQVDAALVDKNGTKQAKNDQSTKSKNAMVSGPELQSEDPSAGSCVDGPKSDSGKETGSCAVAIAVHIGPASESAEQQSAPQSTASVRKVDSDYLKTESPSRRTRQLARKTRELSSLASGSSSFEHTPPRPARRMSAYHSKAQEVSPLALNSSFERTPPRRKSMSCAEHLIGAASPCSSETQRRLRERLKALTPKSSSRATRQATVAAPVSSPPNVAVPPSQTEQTSPRLTAEDRKKALTNVRDRLTRLRSERVEKSNGSKIGTILSIPILPDPASPKRTPLRPQHQENTMLSRGDGYDSSNVTVPSALLKTSELLTLRQGVHSLRNSNTGESDEQSVTGSVTTTVSQVCKLSGNSSGPQGVNLQADPTYFV